MVDFEKMRLQRDMFNRLRQEDDIRKQCEIIDGLSEEDAKAVLRLVMRHLFAVTHNSGL